MCPLEWGQEFPSSTDACIANRLEEFPPYLKNVHMQVLVELFGIPRARAGVDQTSAIGSTLGDVFLNLAERFPQLGEACLDGCRLKAGFIANLRGERFVTDPAIELAEGDAILLMSLDAGG